MGAVVCAFFGVPCCIMACFFGYESRHEWGRRPAFVSPLPASPPVTLPVGASTIESARYSGHYLDCHHVDHAHGGKVVKLTHSTAAASAVWARLLIHKVHGGDDSEGKTDGKGDGERGGLGGSTMVIESHRYRGMFLCSHAPGVVKLMDGGGRVVDEVGKEAWACWRLHQVPGGGAGGRTGGGSAVHCLESVRFPGHFLDSNHNAGWKQVAVWLTGPRSIENAARAESARFIITTGGESADGPSALGSSPAAASAAASPAAASAPAAPAAATDDGDATPSGEAEAGGEAGAGGDDGEAAASTGDAAASTGDAAASTGDAAASTGDAAASTGEAADAGAAAAASAAADAGAGAGAAPADAADATDAPDATASGAAEADGDDDGDGGCTGAIVEAASDAAAADGGGGLALAGDGGAAVVVAVGVGVGVGVGVASPPSAPPAGSVHVGRGTAADGYPPLAPDGGV